VSAQGGGVDGGHAGVGVAALARLLLRTRLRSALNSVRARPLGAPAVLLLFGLASAAAYTGLFAAALDVIGGGAAAGEAGATVLGLMTGAVTLASLAAKSSGEGLFAGSAENEFLLARPISLGRLVAARSLCAVVAEPLGTLFLLPLLMAAALAWALPPPVWLVALAISALAQTIVTALSQAIQVAVVRWVPRARRTSLFVVLRLGAAVTMAGAWVAATWVLRAPAAVARHLDELQAWLSFTPVALLTAPLVAYRGPGGGGAALRALLPLTVVATASVALAVGVARRAGLRGWEEAGAPWAETGAAAPPGPPLTLVRREWRQLARDRPRVAALVALPLLLFGVQLVGSVGWSLATATVGRVTTLVVSIVVYLGALGPLAHMQHERRAFWILRAAPLPIGRLLAAKARAWAVLLGGAALVMFVPLALSVPEPRPAAVAAALGLVLGAALMTTVLAVALGAAAADLSDDGQAALGPGTVYLFLFVAGLFNVVVQVHGWDRARLVALYAGAVIALWRAGVAQVGACLDPEARAAPRPRLGDAAILVLIAAAAPLALERGLARVEVSAAAAAIAQVVTLLGLGLAALAVMATPRPAHRRLSRSAPAQAAGATARAGWLGWGVGGGVDSSSSKLRAMLIGLASGAAARLLAPLAFGAASSPTFPPSTWSRPEVLAIAALVACADELVWRGVVQGALQRELTRERTRAGGLGRIAPRWWAAAATLVAAALAARHPTGEGSGFAPWLALAMAPTIARAASGSVLAALVARLVLLASL